jgi:hypothetical protein
MCSSAAPHACRSSRTARSATASSSGGGRVETAIILLIVCTDLGNSFFGTAPVGSDIWLFAIPFTLAMLTMEEGRKWLVRRGQSGVRVGLSAS